MKKLTAKDALNLIEPIPADKFIPVMFTDQKDCCCVLGHLARLTSDDINDYSSWNCDGSKPIISDFRDKTSDFLSKQHGFTKYGAIAWVNNLPTVNGYTEPAIKDRVVHLLKDMVDAGY